MAIMYNMGGTCGGVGTIMNIKLHNTGRLDGGYKLFSARIYNLT